MAVRIEVAYREGIRDIPGEKLKGRIKAEMGSDVLVRVVDVYTIDADIADPLIETLRTDAFIDPVLQEGFVRTPVLFDADWVIEVGFRPGVTDNVGRTAREVIEAAAHRSFGEDEGVYTSKMYFIKGPSRATRSRASPRVYWPIPSSTATHSSTSTRTKRKGAWVSRCPR